MRMKKFRLKQLSRDAIDASRDHEPWFICTQLMLHPVPLDVIPSIITEADLRVAAIVHDVIPQRFPERYLTNDHARCRPDCERSPVDQSIAFVPTQRLLPTRQQSNPWRRAFTHRRRRRSGGTTVSSALVDHLDGRCEFNFVALRRRSSDRC